MTSPTAPCAQNIPIEALSDWRDTPAPDTALSAHIASCPACRARLAGFDRVSAALRRQREIEPDPAIWRRVQARYARKEQPMNVLTRKPIASSIIGAICVLALVVLFAQLLHNRSAGTHPLATGTATTTKLTPSATATPFSISSLPTAAQVWGPNSVAATVNLGDFQVGGITPDGKRLLGYRESADKQNYDVGWLDVATGQITIFDESPVNGTYKLNSAPTCCLTDGRFYVGSNGVPEGSSGSAPFSYDSATGHFQKINLAELISPQVIGGLLYFIGPGGYYTLNLATGATHTIPAPSGESVSPATWPYGTYTLTNLRGQSYLGVYNYETHASVELMQLGAIGNAINTIAFDGDTMFIDLLGAQNPSNPNPNTTLIELDHVMTPGSQPVTIADGPLDGPLAVNARVVATTTDIYPCAPNNCVYAIAWDRALHTLVLLNASENTNVFVQGDYLAIVDLTTQRVTLYDTATLPTQRGG